MLEQIKFKEVIACLFFENLDVLCFRLIKLRKRSSLICSILTDSTPSSEDNIEIFVRIVK